MSGTTIRTDIDSIPPTFTRPLCDLWVSEGEVAVLECNVIARYQPLVLWYRNLKPLLLISGKYVHTYDGDQVQLTIQNVNSEDVGAYECVARNACGLSSSSCHLSMKGNVILFQSTLAGIKWLSCESFFLCAWNGTTFTLHYKLNMLLSKLFLL